MILFEIFAGFRFDSNSIANLAALNRHAHSRTVDDFKLEIA